jgi:hypothetical protein
MAPQKAETFFIRSVPISVKRSTLLVVEVLTEVSWLFN